MGTHILGTNHEELSSRVCSFMKLNTKYGFSSEYYEHVDNMATQYHVQKDANVAIANACYSENIASHPDGWARYFELES